MKRTPFASMVLVAACALPLSLSPLTAEELSDNARLDKAIQNFSQAILENPYSADAFLRRGLAFKAKKDYPSALRDYDKAIAIDPSQPLAINAKAWLLATCPEEKYRNGLLALEMAKTAVGLSPTPNVDFLDTLAAAQAANGDFQAAQTTISQAISLAEKENKANVVEELKKHQASYQAKNPWRQ